jgi:TRAP-type C4-dicarboxylate transport system substrate-binding protein
MLFLRELLDCCLSIKHPDKDYTMKKMIPALVIVFIAFGYSYAPADSRGRAKTTVKMGTLQPKGSALMKILDEFATEVRDKTNNEVAFKFYWGGIQGDESDVLRKMRTKQLQGGGFSGNGLRKIVPAMKILEAPFLFRNSEEFSYVQARLEDTLNKYFEEKGYVVLGWSDLGFVHVFSDAPITSIEIARQQKIWVWADDPVVYAIFRQGLGIEPIPLSLTDVMTSLSTNLVDTVCITPFHAVAFRWYTDLKYMTEVPIFRGVGALLLTKEVWDKISPESQMKIKRILKQGNERANRINREANEEAIELLKKEGISIIPASDLDYLVKSGQKARESLAGKLYSRDLLDRALSLLNEYRKHHPISTFRRTE